MIDTGGETWDDICAFCRKETDLLLDALVSEACDERQTQFIRGQIAGYRAVMALGKPRRPAEPVMARGY